MTQQETNETVRVCGLGFDYWDIPSYIKRRDGIEKEDWELAEEAERERRQHLEN